VDGLVGGWVGGYRPPRCDNVLTTLRFIALRTLAKAKGAVKRYGTVIGPDHTDVAPGHSSPEFSRLLIDVASEKAASLEVEIPKVVHRLRFGFSQLDKVSGVPHMRSTWRYIFYYICCYRRTFY
jgi:hypothetical protein